MSALKADICFGQIVSESAFGTEGSYAELIRFVRLTHGMHGPVTVVRGAFIIHRGSAFALFVPLTKKSGLSKMAGLTKTEIPNEKSIASGETRRGVGVPTPS